MSAPTAIATLAAQMQDRYADGQQAMAAVGSRSAYLPVLLGVALPSFFARPSWLRFNSRISA